MKSVIFAFVVLFGLCAAPFIGVGKNYDAVIADAARMYGLEAHEYEIVFTDKVIINAAGEEATGLFHEENGVYVIKVHKTFSRPYTIATIFHEFAHAAQKKYNLDTGKYNKEQHAELLAFNTMWQSKYWWNAVHMLGMHSFYLKPPEYRVTYELWGGFITGASIVDFPAKA
jgi:hypothetical protein